MNDLFDLGETLRAARERRGLSQAEVAAATRIKVHLIAAIEKNDFSRIAVPLYGKGFVKMYAECVGLDPAPLIRQYLNGYARSVQPSLHAESPPSASAIQRSVKRPVSTFSPPPRFGRLHLQDIVQDISGALQEGHARLSTWVARLRRKLGGARRGFAYARAGRSMLPSADWRPYLLAGAGVVLVLGMLVFGIARLIQKARSTDTGATSGRPALRLAEEPPPPFLKARVP